MPIKDVKPYLTQAKGDLIAAVNLAIKEHSPQDQTIAAKTAELEKLASKEERTTDADSSG